jgi:hypothetical protein
MLGSKGDGIVGENYVMRNRIILTIHLMTLVSVRWAGRLARMGMVKRVEHIDKAFLRNETTFEIET